MLSRRSAIELNYDSIEAHFDYDKVVQRIAATFNHDDVVRDVSAGISYGSIGAQINYGKVVVELNYDGIEALINYDKVVRGVAGNFDHAFCCESWLLRSAMNAQRHRSTTTRLCKVL